MPSGVSTRSRLTADIYTVFIGLIWTLAIWRILVAAMQYTFLLSCPHHSLCCPGKSGFVAGCRRRCCTVDVYESIGKSRRTALNLHSTQLISGALFIILGLLMLNGTLATLNSVLTEIEWIDNLRYALVERFSQ